MRKMAWQLGASVPRAIADTRKWLEQHLAEYRRQTAALTDDFAGMADIKHGELKDIVLKHAETVKRDALLVSIRLVRANDAAKSFQKNLQVAAAEWNQSQDVLERERQRFKKTSQELDDAINLRGVNWYWQVGSLGGQPPDRPLCLASLKSAIKYRATIMYRLNFCCRVRVWRYHSQRYHDQQQHVRLFSKNLNQESA